MHEALRRQYLALLGIEQWLPRGETDALAEVHLPAGVVVESPSPVAARHPLPGGERENPQLPPLRLAEGSVPSADSPAGQAQDAVNTPPFPVGENGAANRPLSAVGQKGGANVTLSPAGGEGRGEGAGSAPHPIPTDHDTRPGRFACAWLLLADGLLVVASLNAPDAPGLSGAEQELLMRMATALAPGRASLPLPVEYHWPPRGVRVPGLARPAEAEKSLREQLTSWKAGGVRDLLVLGDTLVSLLQPLADSAGMCLVLAPSLGAMLADPQAKRACWDLARPLVRQPS